MTTFEKFMDACERRVFEAVAVVEGQRIRLNVKLSRWCDWESEVSALTAATPRERCDILAQKFLDPNSGELLFSGADLWGIPARDFEGLLRLFLEVNTNTYKDPEEAE